MYQDYFVSCEWLNENRENNNIIILDVTMPPPTQPMDCEQLWRDCHIPCAQYFNQDVIADTQSTSLPHMLPSAEFFAQHVSKMGIDNQTIVVLYDQGNMFSAPRAWWTFTTMGCQHVRILNGGLSAWKQAGYPVESGNVSTPASKTFIPQLHKENVISKDDVLALIDDPEIQIIDARSADRFNAQAPEPRPGLEMGHIPHSKNVPWNTLIENGHYKNPAQLKAIFEQQGVSLSKYLVTSCGSGMTAAVLFLGLRLIGHQNIRLYDGSWAEWGSDKKNPIEK